LPTTGTTLTASRVARRTAATVAGSQSTALSARRRHAAKPVPDSAVAPTATGDDDTIRKLFASRAHIGCAAATTSVRSVIRTRAAAAATVKASGSSRSVTANKYYQLLSRLHWNDGRHTTGVDCGGPRALSAASNNLDLLHALWHPKILRAARVVERLLARKSVRGIVRRHRSTTGATAASSKHRSGDASA
jgi:hypothetical protein